jgi:hypothetical protein
MGFLTSGWSERAGGAGATTLSKLASRSRCVSRLTLLALALFAPILSGCVLDPGNVMPISVALRNEGGEQQLIETLRSDSLQSRNYWNDLLGENLLYVPDNYRTELTSSKDVLFGAVLGSFFYNHPEYDYDALNNLQHKANYCGPACKAAGLENKNPIDLDPALLDYYKNWGRLWQQSLRSGPDAAAIDARYELFKKRIQSYGPFAFSDIRTLIRDDTAFTNFLTRDDVARQWITDHVIRTQDGDTKTELAVDTGIWKFNPVTFTSLPGLAS